MRRKKRKKKGRGGRFKPVKLQTARLRMAEG